MKHVLLLIGLLLVYMQAAVSVTFNPEALRTMQQEGHKIAEQAKDLRTVKLPNDKCLHASGNLGKAGANVEFRDCIVDSKNQQWRIDDQGRLVNQGGKCLGVAGDPNKAGASAVLQDCGSGKAQKWKLDGKQRLVNGVGKCLHAVGNAKTVSGNVVSNDCKEVPNQRWR